MKFKAYSFALILSALGLILGSGALQKATAQGKPYRTIIILDEHTDNKDTREALENLGGRVLKELPLLNGLVVLFPDESVVPNVTKIKGVSRVDRDAQVFTLHHREGHSGGPGGEGDPTPTPAPTDTQVLDWGVDRIDADLTWPTSTGSGVNVAIIDTGIDKDHPDLVNNIAGGVNFVSKSPARPANPNKWDDDNGHGTHVAGIVGASNNTVGTIGTANKTNLWGIKVLDRNGAGYISDVIDGITWSINNGNIDVINMSLGTSSDIKALHDAVDTAYNAGVVLVAAAGNSGDGNGATNDISYPARYANVIAVSATDKNDNSPVWSSEGEEIEVAAPGVNIRSAWKDGGENTISGTSMASPHVAGVVALMLATNNNLSPDQIRATLNSTADDLGTLGFDNFYGHGLVDAEEAVTGVETN